VHCSVRGHGSPDRSADSHLMDEAPL